MPIQVASSLSFLPGLDGGEGGGGEAFQKPFLLLPCNQV